MRVVFMGSPEFSVPVLDALVAAGHDIVAVYCQPPRPAVRHAGALHVQLGGRATPQRHARGLLGGVDLGEQIRVTQTGNAEIIERGHCFGFFPRTW